MLPRGDRMVIASRGTQCRIAAAAALLIREQTATGLIGWLMGVRCRNPRRPKWKRRADWLWPHSEN